MKILVAAIMLCAVSAFAQTVNQTSTGANSPNVNGPQAAAAAPSGELVVKPSPAENALVEVAKEMDATTKAYTDLLNQARANLDAKNKPLIDEAKAKAKKWQDKIDADTKDIKAQIDKNQADAQAQFQKETAGLSAKAVSPQTIAALESVVKEEQNLPPTAHYDLQQKKWVDTAKK
jgi:hypothetical protein